jgi:hypothetical protein
MEHNLISFGKAAEDFGHLVVSVAYLNGDDPGSPAFYGKDRPAPLEAKQGSDRHHENILCVPNGDVDVHAIVMP